MTLYFCESCGKIVAEPKCKFCGAEGLPKIIIEDLKATPSSDPEPETPQPKSDVDFQTLLDTLNDLIKEVTNRIDDVSVKVDRVLDILQGLAPP